MPSKTLRVLYMNTYNIDQQSRKKENYELGISFKESKREA